jgi:hypothetical protein
MSFYKASLKSTNAKNSKSAYSSYSCILFSALISLFFIIAFAAAADIVGVTVNVNDTTPNITVVYNETIKTGTIAYSLKNQSNVTLNSYLSAFTTNQQMTEIYFQILLDLSPASYTFSIKACDVVNNCGDYYIKPFNIILPPLNITIDYPRFAIFKEVPSLLRIKTNREAMCRYGLSNETYDNMEFYFINDGTFKLNHTEASFWYVVNDVYFVCKDKFLETVSSHVQFYSDPNEAILQVSATNAFSKPLKSQMKVVSANNKPIQCKYTKDISKDYAIMTSFRGYDEYVESKYMTELTQEIKDTDLQDKLEDGKENVYYVQCITKAGVLSVKEAVSIDVDSTRPIGITINSPEGFMNSTAFKINITTVVPAKCSYRFDNDTAYKEFDNNSVPSTYLLSTPSKTFFEGAHVAYVKCEDVTKAKKEEQESAFTLDMTSPVVVNVSILSSENFTNKIVDKDSIKIYYKVAENGSGIEYLEYMIYEVTRLQASNVTQWEAFRTTKLEGNKSITVKLNNQSNYYVRLRAADQSGRVSEDLKSNTVLFDPTISGPTVSCTNGKKDGEETDVDCGGNTCNDCAINKTCKLSTDCNTNFCTKDFICGLAGCSDTEMNGDETDVDCGGTCDDKCGLDKKCINDGDCESDNCKSGRCQSKSLCGNGKMDADETDVDCGGQGCNPCANGLNCIVNDDCQSKNCNKGEANSKCFEGDSDSDGDGIKDVLDNCPTVSNPNQEDMNTNSQGDACDSDIDGDGMLNEWETQYNLDPTNAQDASLDSDGDGLTNSQEYSALPMSTDPTSTDTDGDGYSDYDEIRKHHTIATDADSYPKSPVLFFVISVLFILLGILAGYYFYYSQNHYIAKPKKTEEKPKPKPVVQQQVQQKQPIRPKQPMYPRPQMPYFMRNRFSRPGMPGAKPAPRPLGFKVEKPVASVQKQPDSESKIKELEHLQLAQDEVKKAVAKSRENKNVFDTLKKIVPKSKKKSSDAIERLETFEGKSALKDLEKLRKQKDNKE